MDRDFYQAFINLNVNLLCDITTCSFNINNSNVGIKPVNCYPGVVNLSDKILTDAEMSLLSKGLTFVDTPDLPDMGVLTEDLNKFHLSVKRHLALGKFEIPQTNTIPLQTNLDRDTPEIPFSYSKFRNPSKWIPPGPMIVEHMSLLNQEQIVDKYTPKKNIKKPIYSWDISKTKLSTLTVYNLSSGNGL